MLTTPSLALVFVAIAVIFGALALRDYTPARKAWLRIGVIFSAVAIAP